MQPLTYYRSLSPAERAALAERAGTTAKYLLKVMYAHKKGFRPSAELAAQLELASNQKVKRWDLIPEVWHRIWPELRHVEGAPAIPSGEGSAAVAGVEKN